MIRHSKKQQLLRLSSQLMGIGGPESYNYDSATGNLKKKGATGSETAYYYQDSAHKHAVTHLNGTSSGNLYYGYDQNGNMTSRKVSGTTYTLSYDAENRLTAVSGGGVSASFYYDGDGVRVKGTVSGATTLYLGNYYEWSGGVGTKYYYAGAQRIAMQQGSTLYWLFGDRLGSTSRAANADGTPLANGEQRYHPWGEKRYPTGTSGLPTTFRFTGQRQESGLGGADGLYYYGARFYDAALGRFISADTIVPGVGNPMAWDRYAYVLNSPVRFNDPTGHVCSDPEDPNPTCETGRQPRKTVDNWIPTISSDELLLAITIFSETSNGNYPEKAMESIGWVYQNRVTSGTYSSLPEAVAFRQSALTSALKKDFPWLVDLINLPGNELNMLLHQMDLTMTNGANAGGWSAAKVAAITVMDASSQFGYGSSTDPTHGATDFKAKSPGEWTNIKPLYNWRVNNPNIWPTYFYVPQGPFWVGEPLGKWVFVIFDNKSLVTILNPNLLTEK